MSNKVLSQKEIDEFLQAIESCEKDTKSEERTRKVKIFDFKRPDIIGKSLSVAFQHQHSRFPLFGLMECFCSM